MVNIRKILIALYLAITISSTVAMADYTNSEDGVRFRTRPDTEAEIISKLPYGTEVEVIRNGTEWTRIRYDGIAGYVHSDYLQEENPLDGFEHLGEWHITAYTHTGNVCANGNYPTAGYTVACNSLDFGTEIYIEGIGFRTVEDRGPGLLGSSWLDVFMDTYDECIVWGSQYKNVYIKGD